MMIMMSCGHVARGGLERGPPSLAWAAVGTAFLDWVAVRVAHVLCGGVHGACALRVECGLRCAWCVWRGRCVVGLFRPSQPPSLSQGAVFRPEPDFSAAILGATTL